MNGNCYTYLLILPEVSIESPQATSLHCLDYALIYDDNFVEECEQATVHAISVHRKAAFEALDKELALQQPPIADDCHELRISNYFDDLCDKMVMIRILYSQLSMPLYSVN